MASLLVMEVIEMKIVIWIVALAAIVSALPVVNAVSAHDIAIAALNIGELKGGMDADKALAEADTPSPNALAVYTTMLPIVNAKITDWNKQVQEWLPNNYADLLLPYYLPIG